MKEEKEAATDLSGSFSAGAGQEKVLSSATKGDQQKKGEELSDQLDNLKIKRNSCRSHLYQHNNQFLFCRQPLKGHFQW